MGLRILSICLFLAALAFAGCKKDDAAVPANVTSDSATDPAAPASPRGLGATTEELTNAMVIADTGDANATLAKLTGALRDYVVRTRSVPKNFEEFASKSQVSFPPPPAGKKYAIDGQAVVLEKK